MSVSDIKVAKQSYKHVYFVLFLMSCLCALRGPSVCVDTLHYIDIMQSYEVASSRFGLLYGFLQRIVAITHNKQVFFIIAAALTYYPLYYVIKKESSLPAVSVFMFMVSAGLFLETFNLVRQAIAIEYVFLSMYFVNHEKWKLSVASLCFAFMCHKITIVMMPFLLLYKIHIKYWIVLTILATSVIIGLSGTMGVVSDALMYLTTFSSASTTGSFAQMFGSYAISEEFIGEWGIIGKIVNMLPMTLLCIVCHREEKESNIYYNMMLIGTVALNLFVGSVFCVRFSTILSIAQVIAVPQALTNSSRNQALFIYLTLFVFIIVYMRILIGYYNDPNSIGVIPYNFCFE